MRVHYPRTPHLPWSPGASSDDVRAGSLAGLAGREVVVTEKLDGENTTLYPDGLHARSPDSAHHPSRAWVKALHGRIARSIPAGRARDGRRPARGVPGRVFEGDADVRVASRRKAQRGSSRTVFREGDR